MNVDSSVLFASLNPNKKVNMSVDAIYAKRERRQWEPEEKAWSDEALEMPWEDIKPTLHPTTIFCLKNVFFFPHATPIQASSAKLLGSPGSSAVMEAPTGSGKTLAFLVPLMERTIRMGEKMAADGGHPPLTRRILGIIISPSRVLAEQTFVVAKRLAARYPFNPTFALCDGVVETAATALDHLRKCSRGVGSYLVTTPQDLTPFLELLGQEEEANDESIKALLADQDERTKARYLAKLKARSPDDIVHLHSSDENRFLVVVDEADLVFQFEEMRSVLLNFVDQWCITEKKGTKRQRESDERPRVRSDFFFVGATVGVSSNVKRYAEKVTGGVGGSTLHSLHAKGSNDFLAQLNNQYSVCASTDFLTLLIQLINCHPSKKHFLFFNSSRTLLLMKHVLSKLTEGPRPLLFVNNIFVMYESMSESARIQQYNLFLTHAAATARKKEAKPKPLSDAEKKNSFFTSGWKRSGKPAPGHGALLLCTDMAAFGLDVRDVDYVYHFEPPSSVKTYVHRIGRVGRMGMKGSSILLLPCCVTDAAIESRERKVTSNRFNTVTNTKSSTSQLQTKSASLDDLPEEKRAYMNELSGKIALQEHIIQTSAPISSTIRNIVQQDKQALKLARNAAMAMCQGGGEGENAWFTPKLAMECLQLNA